MRSFFSAVLRHQRSPLMVNLFFFIAYIFLYCRSDQLRKKAGIFFGMKFEDNLFNSLQKDLEIIRKTKDLVCVPEVIYNFK